MIGRLVEEDIYKNTDAIGEFINMNGLAYMVIGVFEDSGGDNEERMIYLPVSTTQLIYKNTDEIDQINLTYNLSIGVDGARKMAKDIEVSEKKSISLRRMILPHCAQGLYLNVEQNMAFANARQLIVLFIGIGTPLQVPLALEISWFPSAERDEESVSGKSAGSITKLYCVAYFAGIDFYYLYCRIYRSAHCRFCASQTGTVWRIIL
ncbi:MAG: ABC transporter permease [Flavobacteriaceae bacterium]|nr:ABC transporter permease [Flavobacteriaceae bacterium]